ncbi:MAG TPA: family 43 glycosylhydrolase [Polyangiaceae bacterium]|nr:family 43 glycosylhydrolase [Polyangiaceae bacterium]
MPHAVAGAAAVLSLACGASDVPSTEPARGGAAAGYGGSGTAGSSPVGAVGVAVGGMPSAVAGAGGREETSSMAGQAGDHGDAGGTGGALPVMGTTIINDRFWKDTSGSPIYSQGGGMLQVGDTYYWYGVKYGGAVTYAAQPTEKNGNTSFQGITTYSSQDLVHWKLEATDKPQNAGGWFGRLGVVYHAATKKYVLAAQGGGGLYFATSDKPNGGFVYANVQRDLPGIANGSTGDQTLFQDDDGQAYLVSSSSSGRGNRYVSPLRSSDFLAAEQAVLVYKGGGREGNCMFKYEGHYYFCSSDLHGWNSSQTYCVSASNINGPWSAEFVLKGTEPDYSHVTQTGFFFNVKGTEQTTVIFAGDRWSDFAGNGLGFNQWLPLSFEETTPRFHSLSAWTLNAATGAWQVARENNWALNPTFEADRISVTSAVGWTATSGANSKDARTGNWSWQVTGQGSVSQTIADLPNGSYELSVWAKSSGAGAQLTAKNFGGDKSVAVPAGTSWTEVTLSDIVVTQGHADIAVTAGGQTVTLDDFSFVQQ